MYCLCRLFCSMYCLCRLCCSMYCLCRLCRSVYCLCVNLYCTTATGCQPNCNLQIYHIIIFIDGEKWSIIYHRHLHQFMWITKCNVSRTEPRITKLLCFCSVLKGILWSVMAYGVIFLYMSYFTTKTKPNICGLIKSKQTLEILFCHLNMFLPNHIFKFIHQISSLRATASPMSHDIYMHRTPTLRPPPPSFQPEH